MCYCCKMFYCKAGAEKLLKPYGWVIRPLTILALAPFTRLPEFLPGQSLSAMRTKSMFSLARSNSGQLGQADAGVGGSLLVGRLNEAGRSLPSLHRRSLDEGSAGSMQASLGRHQGGSSHDATQLAHASSLGVFDHEISRPRTSPTLRRASQQQQQQLLSSDGAVFGTLDRKSTGNTDGGMDLAYGSRSSTGSGRGSRMSRGAAAKASLALPRSPRAATIWHEVTVEPYVDPITGGVAMLVTQSDATARMETEAALARMNEVRSYRAGRASVLQSV